jgi:SAM-dependent methyltransferase
MTNIDHPWEKIYKREGRFFAEPYPRFYELVRTFKDYGYSAILDLGCGNGRHTVHLAKEGFDITDLDISPTGLRLTQEWLAGEGQHAPLILADMRSPLPIRDGAFDGLLSTQVIHHALLAEVRKSIGEIWRLLKPGGLAFVTVAGCIHDDEEHVEIEPGTFIPQSGFEAGLPHHIFTEQELGLEFKEFVMKDVSLRDERRVLAILAQKPE